MTYTADHRIISQGTATAAQIDGWFAALGPLYAPKYAPDKQYKAAPAELGQAIINECKRYPQYVVNHDLAAAQIVHETAAWQSAYARFRNNPGGLGAINSDPDQAITFPSARAGVQAHVAHMLVYAVGDGPWSAADPRYDPVVKAGWLGKAPRLLDLNGKWAYPGTNYGQSIAGLANQLTAFRVEEPKRMEPPVDWTPPQIRVDYVPAGRANAPDVAITPKRIIWHDTGNPARGANAEMHKEFVHNGGGREGVSFQFAVDDKEIWAIIPINRKAYHALEPCNTEGIGIELCINNDGDWERTLWNAAWLGHQLEQQGIARHEQHFNCTQKNCPAKLRIGGEWQRFLDRIAYFRDQSKPEPKPDAIELNGFKIQFGFKGFWEELAGYEPTLPYRVLGLPTEDEWSPEPGIAYQRFERGVLKWSQHEPAPWHIHLKRRDEAI